MAAANRWVCMARVARLVVPEVALHVVQRGVDRGDCFFAEAHYRGYLQLLAAYAPRFGCSVHAYCLMTNHVHLLLTPHAPGACARLMKQVNQCYVQRLNKSQGRTGTLWEGRFRSALVSSEIYALTCYRYIELNPVRAGMVAHPRDYRWSSYRANAEETPDSIISPHATYAALSDCPSRRALAYRELFVCALRETDVAEIRQATRSGRRIGEARPARASRPRSVPT
jgi:putative transposase